MKPFFLVSILIFLSFFQSCSQTVPKATTDAFSKKFLGAKDVIWQVGPNKDWTATFYMEKFNYMTAYYTSKGEFEAFEIEVNGEDIPKNLVQKVFLKYPSATIYSVFEKNTIHDTKYIFEIIDNGNLFGLLFKENGKIIIIPKDDYRFQKRVRIEND